MPAGRLTPARHWLLLPLLGAAALLAVSEFLTLYEIRAITAVPDGGTDTGGSHHGYALLVVGIALAAMAWGAVIGGSGPAKLGVVVLTAAALFVVVAIDVPDVNDEGVIGERYEQAEARPQIGFYLETAGVALALIGTAGLFLTPPARRVPRQVGEVPAG
jgi:hypothetical protein